MVLIVQKTRAINPTNGYGCSHPLKGSLMPKKFGGSDIQQYVTDRAGKVSPGSVVKELNVLKHILGLAVEWELIPVNPAVKVKSPSVPEGRARYLQPTELRAVLQECPAWLRPIVGLAAFTAMRRGEILALRWLNVDLGGRRLMLSQTKNGSARIVHLNQLATEVIHGQWRENAKPSDRVSPWRMTAQRTTSAKDSRRFVGVSRLRTCHSIRYAIRARLGYECRAQISTR
jgi:integrase